MNPFLFSALCLSMLSPLGAQKIDIEKLDLRRPRKFMPVAKL
jgi:hypothetical protein